MGEFSIGHWLVVLIVILLLFGPKKMPDIARSLGESIKEFKKSLKEGLSEESSQETSSSNPTLIKDEKKSS